jgi:predicted metal-dependent peptidase
LLHVLYDHFSRRGDRNHQLWNIANDYCVNGDLIKHKVGEKITTVPCLHDPKFSGLSSEAVYDLLYKKIDKISINDLLSKLIDEHVEFGDNTNNKGQLKVSEADLQELRNELKEAVVSASQTCDMSNVPAGIKRMVQELTAPKLNWREILRMQLESTIRSDYTWMRASRKGWHLDAIIPGTKNDEMIDIAVAIDTSGSISDKQTRDFINEIAGITEAFPSYCIHLFSFDTRVYNALDYTSENLDSINEYPLCGGGGTDFTSIFSHLKDSEIKPARLVVFTDGYPNGSWGDPLYCDTVWVIHGSNSAPTPPFGDWVLYEE